jgi:hypothetical protein
MTEDETCGPAVHVTFDRAEQLWRAVCTCGFETTAKSPTTIVVLAEQHGVFCWGAEVLFDGREI